MARKPTASKRDIKSPKPKAEVLKAGAKARSLKVGDSAPKARAPGAKERRLPQEALQQAARTQRKANETIQRQNEQLQTQNEELTAQREELQAQNEELIAQQEELRKTTEALQESEQKYSTLFDKSPFATSLTRMPDGTLISANDAFLKLFEYTREEIVGKTSVDLGLADPASRAQVAAEMKRRGEVRNFECARVTKTGAERNLALNLDWVSLGGEKYILTTIHDITDRVRTEHARRQAEEALRLSEEKFALAFANNAAAIALTRLEDGVFLDVNKTWEEMNGYRREEAIGASAMSLPIWPTPEARGRFAQELQRAGALHGWEQPFLRRSGETYVAELSAQVFTIQGEKVILSTLVDITARKRAEEALRESEERFRTVLESSADVIYRLNMQTGQFDYISPSAAQIVGFSPEALMTQTSEAALAMIHPDDLPAMRAALELLGQTGTATAEYRQQTSGGEYRWLSNHMTLTRDATGQALYRNGNIRDITDRRQAEKAIQQARDELAATFASMTEAVMVYDATGKVERANPVAVKLLGFDPGRLVMADMPQRLSTRHPDGRPLDMAEAPSLRALHGETVADEPYLITRPDGSSVTVITNAAPLLAAGQVIGAVILFHDVTEQEQTRTQLEESRRLLEALMAYVPEGITIADAPDMRIRMVSRHGQDLLGGPHAGLTATQVAAQWQVFQKDGVTPMAEADLPLMRAALKGETVVDQELVQVNAAGRSLPLLCNAAPIRDQQGAIVGGIVTWHDITERKQAEFALSQSEERYRALFNGMTEGFALHDIICDETGTPCDYRFLAVNPAFERLTGLTAQEVTGKLKSQVEALRNDDPKWVEIYGKVALSGEPVHFENYSPPLKRWYEVYAYRPAPAQFAVIIMDVTERKEREKELRQLNRTLKALGKSSQAMLRAKDEAGYLAEVCRIVTEDCGHAMVWIGWAEADENLSVRPAAYAGFEAGYLETLKITWADTERGRGPTGTAIRTGKVSLCRNMLTDPSFEPWRAEALKRGYASSIVFPLMADGRVFGALTIYSREPDPFAPAEIGLLSELANDLALGVTAIRLRAAQAKAEGTLRESEERYRLLFQNSQEGILLTRPDGDIQAANPAACRLFGRTEEEICRLGRNGVVDLSDPRLPPYLERRARTGHGEGELLMRRADGTRFVAEVSSTVFKGSDGELRTSMIVRDITERKQVEQERERLLHQLEVEKARWQATVENMLDPVTVCDAEGRAIYMNAAYSRLVERQIDPTLAVEQHADHYQLYRPDGTLFPIEDLPLQRAALFDASVENVEIVQRTPGGADRVVIWNAAPLHDANGVSGAVAVGRDVTAQRQAERQLQAQTETLREQAHMLDLAHVLVRNMEDAIIFWNRGAEELYGWTKSEALGQNTHALFQTVFPQPAEAIRSELLETGHWEGELRHTRRNGTRLVVASHQVVHRDKDGRPIAIIEVNNDVTALTRAEEALRQARDELEVRVQERTAELEDANAVLEEEIEEHQRAEEQVRQQAQRLAAVAETSHVLVEASFNLQAMLDQVARAVALSVGDACLIRLLSPDAQRLEVAAFYHADANRQADLRAFLGATSQGIAEGLTGRVFHAREPIFLPAVSPTDLRRLVRSSALPYLDQETPASLMVVPLMVQANVLGTLAIYRLTPECPYTLEDLKLLQTVADRLALALTNARLHQDLETSLDKEKAIRQQLVQAEKLGALGRMVGSVAHELNNPLQTIRNCLYLTDEDLPPNSPIHAYLEMAQAETQRLVDLVAQLRELYRMRPTTAPTARRLDALLRDVKTLMVPQLQDAQVRWELPGDLPDYKVNVIQDRLKQVFINLASNAIEAMRPAGGQLQVDLALSADGQQVGVRFKDTGPGIPAENLSRLFEPFFTTKPQGLGLGLAICYEIVQQHGGQIAADSLPGQGATFTVWLPRAASG